MSIFSIFPLIFAVRQIFFGISLYYIYSIYLYIGRLVYQCSESIIKKLIQYRLLVYLQRFYHRNLIYSYVIAFFFFFFFWVEFKNIMRNYNYILILIIYYIYSIYLQYRKKKKTGHALFVFVLFAKIWIVLGKFIDSIFTQIEHTLI